jgi:phage FluMu protein Com
MSTKNLSVHHRDDGTTYFEKKCMMCGKVSNFTVPTEKYGKWMSGRFVQDVFPEYSVDDREKMVSGTCPECFNKLFHPDED